MGQAFSSLGQCNDVPLEFIAPTACSACKIPKIVSFHRVTATFSWTTHDNGSAREIYAFN